LGVPVSIGVGATIDFLAGQKKRAPRWMQRAGLEWTFRLMQEPRRLGPRYAADLYDFSSAILAQWWQMHAPAHDANVFEQPASILVEPTWLRFRAPERFDAASLRRNDASWRVASEAKRHCLIDLAGVQFIDSVAFGFLMRLNKRVRFSGHCLVLVAPSNCVRRVLRRARLEDYFLTASDALEAKELIWQCQEASSPVSVDLTGALAWQGEVTAANTTEVWNLTKPRLDILARQHSQFSIDISNLRFIDSSGVGLMIRAWRRARERDATLSFASAQPNVRNVLRLAKLERVLLRDIS